MTPGFLLTSYPRNNLGREDYPADELVPAMAQGFEGIFLVGMGCLSIPAKAPGARVTALLCNFLPVKISRGWTVNHPKEKQKKEFGIEVWKYVTWGMRRIVLATVFSTKMSRIERAKR